MSENTTSTPAASERPHRAGAFDIRNFIGALMGLYGVILVVTGLFFTSEAEIEQAADVNVNLWAGLALVLTCAFFLTWARLRPVVVPPSSEDEPSDDRPPGH